MINPISSREAPTEMQRRRPEQTVPPRRVGEPEQVERPHHDGEHDDERDQERGVERDAADRRDHRPIRPAEGKADAFRRVPFDARWVRVSNGSALPSQGSSCTWPSPASASSPVPGSPTPARSDGSAFVRRHVEMAAVADPIADRPPPGGVERGVFGVGQPQVVEPDERPASRRRAGLQVHRRARVRSWPSSVYHFFRLVQIGVASPSLMPTTWVSLPLPWMLTPGTLGLRVGGQRVALHLNVGRPVEAGSRVVQRPSARARAPVWPFSTCREPVLFSRRPESCRRHAAAVAEDVPGARRPGVVADRHPQRHVAGRWRMLEGRGDLHGDAAVLLGE